MERSNGRSTFAVVVVKVLGSAQCFFRQQFGDTIRLSIIIAQDQVYLTEQRLASTYQLLGETGPPQKGIDDSGTGDFARSQGR